MQDQFSAARARYALHECGCLVAYATDKHGEYPLSVEGCALNDRITAYLRSGRISDPVYLTAIKGHRGREVR